MYWKAISIASQGNWKPSKSRTAAKYHMEASLQSFSKCNMSFRASGTPHLWYGHISMVMHHRNLLWPHIFDAFSTVCKSFFILDVVSQDVYILYFNLFTKVLFYFFASISTYISKRMCVVIEWLCVASSLLFRFCITLLPQTFVLQMR